MTGCHWRGVIGVAAAFIFGLGCVESGRGAWLYGKAVIAQHLLSEAWAETRATDGAVRPWPWADTWPVARIAVPRLDADAVVLADVSGESLAFGPGHLPGTPPPGRAGTSLVAGHRDTHFAFLRDIEHGDVIHIEATDNRSVRFRVTDVSVVDSPELVLDSAADGNPALMLITCWPFDSIRPNPRQRYVVYARAIPDRAIARGD